MFIKMPTESLQLRHPPPTPGLPLKQTLPLAFLVARNGISILLVAQLQALESFLTLLSLGPTSNPLVNSQYSQTLSTSYHLCANILASATVLSLGVIAVAS